MRKGLLLLVMATAVCGCRGEPADPAVYTVSKTADGYPVYSFPEPSGAEAEAIEEAVWKALKSRSQVARLERSMGRYHGYLTLDLSQGNITQVSLMGQGIPESPGEPRTVTVRLGPARSDISYLLSVKEVSKGRWRVIDMTYGVH